MTLDEMEKLADAVQRANAHTGNTGTSSDKLAEAILRYAPVVRAAEVWRDEFCDCESCLIERADDESVEATLMRAIDAARKEQT